MTRRLPKPLAKLQKTWLRPVTPARRVALGIGLFMVLMLVAHGARLGTLSARLFAAGTLLICLLLTLLLSLRRRRKWADQREVARLVLTPVDARLAASVQRAIGVVEATSNDPLRGSEALATHHYERLLQAASRRAVEAAARQHAGRWRWASFAALLGLVAALVPDPMRVIEGLDVLFAYQGEAPVSLSYLERVRVSIKPPSHVRGPVRHLTLGARSSAAEGSMLTLNGLPLHQGRNLVLTDGMQEVSLISDGSGGLVGSWQLGSSSELRLAARFGEVLIVEPRSLVLEAVPDTAPLVFLEGAPRRINLLDLKTLELRYIAKDDHGLRQIDLVLRSGGEEERRPLLQLDGDDLIAQGGHALEADDPSLRRLFLPVSITIEARDNDSEGAKWGRSAAVVVVPTPVGAGEAERYQALAKLRDRLVDIVATLQQVASGEGADGESTKAQRQALETMINGLNKTLKSALEESYGGLKVPDGIGNFFRGQVALLQKRGATVSSRLRRAEDVALALDVALSQIAHRDARSVAGLLADVVEEVAVAAHALRGPEPGQGADERLAHALELAKAGATELGQLGELGQDLGSVAIGDLDRVSRAKQQNDMLHTELAARHLAERLRRPNPSFGSAGGSGPGGVESGGGTGGPPQGPASRANQHFNELAGELEQLAREHQGRIDAVEQALQEAEQDLDLGGLANELKRRAEDLKNELSDLPRVGANPDTARARAALGHEHGRAMAQNMESADLDRAIESGQEALDALGAAQRRARETGDWLDEEAVGRAEAAVNRELQFLKQKRGELRQSAREQARSKLSQAAQSEAELARRAGNIAGRGESAESALPPELVQRLKQAENHMRRASQHLQAGDGEKALEAQQAAQRLLENSRTGKTSDADRASNDEREARQDGVRTGGKMPDTKAEDPGDLRERILKGLGRKSDSALSPAVRRYAEELLR